MSAVRRQIDPRMVSYLDKKLAGDTLFQMAIKQKDCRLALVRAAAACVGIREHGGNNRGPEVELFQETIGGHSSESWCMSSVQTLIAYVELKTGILSSIIASEGCLDVWNRSPKSLRVVFSPLPGALVIFRHGKTSNGHTGIVEAADNDSFYDYEGNTESGLNSGGKVIRDGGGYYRVLRSRAGAGNMKVVGYLKPWA